MVGAGRRPNRGLHTALYRACWCAGRTCAGRHADGGVPLRAVRELLRFVVAARRLTTRYRHLVDARHKVPADDRSFVQTFCGDGAVPDGTFLTHLQLLARAFCAKKPRGGWLCTA